MNLVSAASRSWLLITVVLASPVFAAPPASGIFYEDFCADPMRATCETISTGVVGRTKFLTENLESVGAVELRAVVANVGKIKALLNAVIDREYPPEGALTKIPNRDYKKIVETTIVLDSTGLDERAAKKDPLTGQLGSAFMQACGQDGLELNAFALRTTDGSRFLLVCPGLLMGVAHHGNDARENLNNLIFVLAHEFSHHFDALKFPLYYENFRRCLVEHHAGDLLPGKFEQVSMALKDARARDEALVEKHSGEISADYWGAAVLAEYLRTSGLGDGVKAGSKLNAIRQAFGVLCSSNDDGVHPTGEFRLRVMMRSSPAFAGLMGCKKAASKKPGCNLMGAIR